MRRRHSGGAPYRLAKSHGPSKKRPLSVTIIGWLFIAAGTIGFAYHLKELKADGHFDYGAGLVLLVRLLAILSGLFLLRGSNWARWLLILWIAYHVILSTFHSLIGVATHSLLLIVIAYFLFRPRASDYFR